MTVSLSLLDEFKATVWRQARIPDREPLPRTPGGVPYLPRRRPGRAGQRAKRRPHGRGTQFRQHGQDVMAGGLGGDEQPGGDLGVSVAGADQVECLPLTPGQAQPMGLRRDPRPGRDRPDAQLAHLLPGDPGRGHGAQAGEESSPPRAAVSALPGAILRGHSGLAGSAEPLPARHRHRVVNRRQPTPRSLHSGPMTSAERGMRQMRMSRHGLAMSYAALVDRRPFLNTHTRLRGAAFAVSDIALFHGASTRNCFR
jgi:hypothetical protein